MIWYLVDTDAWILKNDKNEYLDDFRIYLDKRYKCIRINYDRYPITLKQCDYYLNNPDIFYMEYLL